MHRAAVLTLALVLASAALPQVTTSRASTQQGTPAARSHVAGRSVVASDLTNPRGMAWGPDGTLYIAVAGSGGTTPGTPAMPAPLGPSMAIIICCPVFVFFNVGERREENSDTSPRSPRSLRLKSYRDLTSLMTFSSSPVV